MISETEVVTTIVLADDHPVVLNGLKATIEKEAGLKVIANAGDGEAALALIKELRPNLTILDIDMPKLDGLGVAREIVRLGLETKFVFLSLHKDEELFRAALDQGAKGYLLKDSAMQEVVIAIQAVAAGRMYFSPAIAMQLLHPEEALNKPPAKSSNGDLTPSERRILQLIADGLSSKEIGAELSIHYRTVENHRTNICRKLRIEGANALLRYAVQSKNRFS
jgi:DNA-binding NarL/FixJ family response regulator